MANPWLRRVSEAMTEKSSPAIASTVLKVGQKRQDVKTNQTISN